MIGGASRVFTIPAGVAFADALAKGLLSQAAGDPLRLADMLILLPTRRAVRAVTDGFLRIANGQAMLLPRLLALADVDDDAAFFGAESLPPAIDPLDRLFLLARLVLTAGRDFAATPDQALRLAASLAELIDEVEAEGIDFAKLAELAPEEFAHHWQQTLSFLQIVTEHWPAILSGQGLTDVAARRRVALEGQAARWRDNPPATTVIAAGFITADPALADLIGVVANLPNGSVILAGLDRELDNESWDAVAPSHPQFGLKHLLDRIGIARSQVLLWPAVDTSGQEKRVRLLADTLRPAETTEHWRKEPVDAEALSGISRLDCASSAAEAEAIALAMRGVLETPGRTAALVTPDRQLARRVAAALRRWTIEIDDSAGLPLSDTPVGTWLRLVAETVSGGFAPRPLLAMLKHPMAACGLAPEMLRRHVRALERAVLRGPRPAPGLGGLVLALKEARPSAFDGGPDEKQAVEIWLNDFVRRMKNFAEMSRTSGASLAELARLHGEAAEALADTADEAGGLRLWQGQDGEAAAELLHRLEDSAAQAFPELTFDRYPAVLDVLMATIPIRPLYGTHPRLAIWGLIEARLQSADLIILGGLNEGTWPPQPQDEPWMSRPMRAEFGLPALETAIGLAAHDFVLAACAPEILLTRAERVDGAPTVPARFLSRLKTRLAAAGLKLPVHTLTPWRDWADSLDRPSTPPQPWQRPRPTPPLAARPRSLPVTAIDLWMRDPYALYARYVLRLRAIDPIDADPSAAERGQFIHAALDQFIRTYPAQLPDDAVERLLDIGREIFGDRMGHPAVAAFWWPRFERVAHWFIGAFETPRRRDGVVPVATEIKGRLELKAPGGKFTLLATADRIDRHADGKLAILDYKTGRLPSAAEIAAGVAPQLPLEAAIAQSGQFGDIAKAIVGELAFLRLTGGNPAGEYTGAVSDDGLQGAIAAAHAGLIRLVASFDDPAQPYLASPRPEFVKPSDYDHLARVEEWSLDGGPE